MTKILLSAIVTDMRNSTAGSTFTKNRYGNVLRKKQTPVKQNTGFQNAWRQVQSSVARSWKSLDDSTRQAWIDATSNFPYQDKFGNTKYLSGFALYQQLSLNLYLIGVTGQTDAPSALEVPSILDATVTVSFDYANWQYSIFIEYGVIDQTNEPRLVCYVTQPGSPGKMYFGNTKYFIGYTDTSAGDHDFGPDFSQFFGIPSPGQKIFLEFVLILAANGQRGVSLVTSAILPVYIPLFSNTLTSGVSWNFFINFQSGGYVVPVGCRAVLYEVSGTGPIPDNPPVTGYIFEKLFNEGASTNPATSATTNTSGSTNWIWWRMELQRLSDSSVLFIAYSSNSFNT